MTNPRPPHLSVVGATPSAGVRLGTYLLLERLGEGGMAEVWKGTRQVGVGNAGKTVAVKLIASHSALNPDYQRMFLREARVSLLLSHANIAQVFDVDVDPSTNQLYMAMEYVHGLNLHQFIQRMREDAVPYPMVGYIIGEVLRGLTYAHEVEQDGESISIVHRDISPHNIMVSISGEVKITDFGIASISTEATTGTVKGKLQYMPPEQLLGDSRNPTVDLFSVGAVLHELLEGKPFRDAVDAARMYGMILSGSKPDLQRPNVPAGLAILRDRLLEVDVSKRAPSARIALEYLYRWDGYRNASLDLGKLVKDLLQRQETTEEFGRDYSDTVDAAMQAESEIRTEFGQALEPHTNTERSVTPESRVPTERAPELPSQPPAVEFEATALPSRESRTSTVQAIAPRSGTMVSTSAPAPASTPNRSRGLLFLALSLVATVVFAAIVFKSWFNSTETPETASVPNVVELGPSETVATDEGPMFAERESSSTGGRSANTSSTDTTDSTVEMTETETETETDSGESSSSGGGIAEPDPSPSSPPPKISAVLTASSEYKVWVEIKFGNSTTYIVDWPEPTVRIRIRPGSYPVEYRREPDEDWISGGTVRIPRNGPVKLKLAGGVILVD